MGIVRLPCYVLDENKQPQHEPDVIKWVRYMADESLQRIVDQTIVAPLLVSTVFIGIDLSEFGEPPILWETRLFNGKRPMDYVERYHSYSQAEKGHRRAVAVAERLVQEQRAKQILP